MGQAIVLCSGGLDSVVTSYFVKKVLKYNKIIVLFFDYGQRTNSEEERSAKYFTKDLKAEFLKIKIPMLKELSGDLLSGKTSKKINRGDLKDTKNEANKWYLPYRNLIFLSYAFSVAEGLELKGNGKFDVFVGFKNEGRESYPDTTMKFVNALNKLSKESSENKIKVIAPFIKKDKEDIVLLGRKLGVKLDKTWSCYVGKRIKQCGTCLACMLRKEGFYWANINDPTTYAS